MHYKNIHVALQKIFSTTINCVFYGGKGNKYVTNLIRLINWLTSLIELHLTD